jgi:hypothetical protein
MEEESRIRHTRRSSTPICTSRDTNLSKTTWKTTVKVPSRTPQEPEDLAPYNAPCQQEAVKEIYALPQFLILSPYLHHY